MLIINDLKKTTIKNSIEKIMEDGFFELIFSEIGSLSNVYSKDLDYNDVTDESNVV